MHHVWIKIAHGVWTLQELQCDASLFQVFNNDVKVLWAGLSVEVSQEGDVQTIVLFPPEKKQKHGVNHIVTYKNSNSFSTMNINMHEKLFVLLFQWEVKISYE